MCQNEIEGLWEELKEAMDGSGLNRCSIVTVSQKIDALIVRYQSEQIHREQ